MDWGASNGALMSELLEFVGLVVVELLPKQRNQASKIGCYYILLTCAAIFFALCALTFRPDIAPIYALLTVVAIAADIGLFVYQLYSRLHEYSIWRRLGEDPELMSDDLRSNGLLPDDKNSLVNTQNKANS